MFLLNFSWLFLIDAVQPDRQKALATASSMRSECDSIAKARSLLSESGISLAGSCREPLKNMAREASLQCWDQYRDIIKEKIWNKIKTIPDIDWMDVKTAYCSGVVIQAKCYDRLHQADYLAGMPETHTIAKQYGKEFLRSLLISSRQRRIRAKSALLLAQRVYILPPDIIEQLRSDFPEEDNDILLHYATNNPSGPTAFIAAYQERLQQLKHQHPGVSEGVLKHAARNHPKNPDAYINKRVSEKRGDS